MSVNDADGTVLKRPDFVLTWWFERVLTDLNQLFIVECKARKDEHTYDCSEGFRQALMRFFRQLDNTPCDPCTRGLTHGLFATTDGHYIVFGKLPFPSYDDKDILWTPALELVKTNADGVITGPGPGYVGLVHVFLAAIPAGQIRDADGSTYAYFGVPREIAPVPASNYELIESFGKDGFSHAAVVMETDSKEEYICKALRPGICMITLEHECKVLERLSCGKLRSIPIIRSRIPNQVHCGEGGQDGEDRSIGDGSAGGGAAAAAAAAGAGGGRGGGAPGREEGEDSSAAPTHLIMAPVGKPLPEYLSGYSASLPASKLNTLANTIFLKVLAALLHAHALGVMHCDVCPSNILIVGQEDMNEPDVVLVGWDSAIRGKAKQETYRPFGLLPFMPGEKLLVRLGGAAEQAWKPTCTHDIDGLLLTCLWVVMWGQAQRPPWMEDVVEWWVPCAARVIKARYEWLNETELPFLKSDFARSLIHREWEALQKAEAAETLRKTKPDIGGEEQSKGELGVTAAAGT